MEASVWFFALANFAFSFLTYSIVSSFSKNLETSYTIQINAPKWHDQIYSDRMPTLKTGFSAACNSSNSVNICLFQLILPLQAT